LVPGVYEVRETNPAWLPFSSTLDVVRVTVGPGQSVTVDFGDWDGLSSSPTPTRTRTATPTPGFVFLPLALCQPTPTATATPSIPDAPILSPITSPEASPNYTVPWAPAPRAESYVLEWAVDPGFSDATQLPTSNTSYQATSKGIATYYYRVKARNGWGDSGWSNVQSVEVRWESEPNDLWDKGANGPLASGKAYYGYPDDSSDYYYLDVRSDGQIVLDLQGHGGQGVHTLVYYGTPSQDLHPQVCTGAPECHLTFAGKRGTYYVRIYTESGFNRASPYTLRVTYP